MVPVRRILESDNSPMRMSNLMVMLDYAGLPHPPPENDDRWWPSLERGLCRYAYGRRLEFHAAACPGRQEPDCCLGISNMWMVEVN